MTAAGRRNPEDTPSIFDRVRAKAFTDRANAAPLWVQVKNAIEDAIEHPVPVGSQLPSEQVLSSMFGVSRPVVRAALEGLVNEGRLVKLPRRGVFTAQPKQEADFLTHAIGVFDDMTAKGHVVTTRTYALYRTVATETERQMLALPAGGDVVRVDRVYLVDGKPLTYTHIAIPAHRAPELEHHLGEGASIFGLLRSRYGLTATRADRWFMAVAASGDQAAKLGIAVGQPLIAVESLAYCGNGSPLEYYTAVYDSSVARMHLAVAQDSASWDR